MYNSDYNRPPEEREPIETEHFHVWDAESPKPPRKKSGAARFVALGLCCALVGGLVGGGGVLAASHLSGGKTTIYQGTSPNSIVSLAHVDGQTVLSPAQIYAANLGATVGVNGGENAGLLALQILGIKYPEIAAKLEDYKAEMKINRFKELRKQD